MDYGASAWPRAAIFREIGEQGPIFSATVAAFFQ
jgi:hypothetical protein